MEISVIANFLAKMSEMRVDCGPGYRLYFTKQGNILIILFCGGDKSTQNRDIRKAKAMAR
jgi:putative addiction module killer protein